MATQTGSIDLKGPSVVFDSSIDALSDEIRARVEGESEIGDRISNAEASIALKIDASTDSTDLISNIMAIADEIILKASQIKFGNNASVDDELTTLNSAISIDTTNETIKIGSGEFYILITPTMMGFYKTIAGSDDVLVAFMQRDQLYVENNLSFGHFVFTERANGHFTLKLID